MKLPRRKRNPLYEIEEDPRFLEDEEAPKPEEKRGSRFFGHLYVFIAIITLALSSRLAFLTLKDGTANANLAEGNRIREEAIRAPRGLILDRKGRVLALNDANFELHVVPGDLPKENGAKDLVYGRISKDTGLTKDEVRLKSEEKGTDFFQPILIKSGIPRNIALFLEADSDEVPGFKIEVNPVREYKNAKSFSHILGYVGRVSEEDVSKGDYLLTDFIGKDGIEKQYEDMLSGTHGARIVEVDVFGKTIRSIGPAREPIPGKPLYLTIDKKLQQVAEEALKKSLSRANQKKGSVVAMDPNTGEIKAIVSLPSYNNNLFAKGISPRNYSKLLKDKSQPLFFRAVQGSYPSGSTLKPFIASAGLQEGIISSGSSIVSTGGLRVKEQFFPDYLAGGHGYTDLNKAIALSVNTFFYMIGGGIWDKEGENIIKQGLGVKRIHKYLKSFGFGADTGIDLPQEAEGLIPDPEWKLKTKPRDCTRGATAEQCWYLGDTYNLSIGQGDFQTTPLQLASALSVIASGGKKVTPHLLYGTEGQKGELQKTSFKAPRKDFISRPNLALIRSAMRETVVSGSGRLLSSLKVDAAGKTGTAEFGPKNEYKHAWFTAFAPYSNPELVVVVLVEGAGEGHDFAVPVANEILKYYFK